MILNFNYDEKKGTISWRFKAQDQKVTVKNPKIVKCYEYLDRILVLSIEEETKMSVLYVYNPEGELSDKVVSTKDFFISGIREGIISPELVVRGKGKEPTIYTYDVKKKQFNNTGEVLKQ